MNGDHWTEQDIKWLSPPPPYLQKSYNTIAVRMVAIANYGRRYPTWCDHERLGYTEEE